MKTFKGVNSAFIYLAKKIKSKGMVSKPRGMEIKELIGEGVCIDNPRNRLTYNKIRAFSPQFAIGENLWYLSGSDKLEVISYYSPSYYKFSDDGVILNGAYGPRIQNQMEECKRILCDDPDSRRAVISILTSNDNKINNSDVPCTCTIQFILREGYLDALVYMRSNDLFLGLPYDIYSFTIIQELMAITLGVNLGKYYHFVGSLHVYEKDYEKLNLLTNIESKEYTEWEMNPFSDNSIDELPKLLKFEEILRKQGSNNIDSEILDKNWRAYQKILVSKVKGDYSKLNSLLWLKKDNEFIE